MKIFLIVLLLELITSWYLFHHIDGDTSDGDLGWGIAFYLLMLVFVVVDVIWVVILLWRSS